MPNGQRLLLIPVAKRPVFYPQLGAFFTALREKRRLGFRQAVNVAQGKKLRALTKQALFGLEHGQTKNADPDVLRAVAELYDVDYPWIVANFVGHRYGLTPETAADLIRLAEEAERRPSARSLITAKDQKLLDRINALDEDDAHLLMTMLKQLEQKERKAAGKKPSRRHHVA